VVVLVSAPRGLTGVVTDLRARWTRHRPTGGATAGATVVDEADTEDTERVLVAVGPDEEGT
jgi:hypothetical protein